MSEAHYERLNSLLELYQKLSEAEPLDASDENGITHHEMISRLRSTVA